MKWHHTDLTVNTTATSTVTAIGMNDMITLICLIQGDDLIKCTFSVTISKNSIVGELKRIIKTENPRTFGNVDVKSLILRKTSISLDIPKELISNVDIQTLCGEDEYLKSVGTELSPLSKISTIFPDDVTDDQIHIVIERPHLQRDLAFETKPVFTCRVYLKNTKKAFIFQQQSSNDNLHLFQLQIKKYFSDYLSDVESKSIRIQSKAQEVEFLSEDEFDIYLNNNKGKELDFVIVTRMYFFCLYFEQHYSKKTRFTNFSDFLFK